MSGGTVNKVYRVTIHKDGRPPVTYDDVMRVELVDDVSLKIDTSFGTLYFYVDGKRVTYTVEEFDA